MSVVKVDPATVPRPMPLVAAAAIGNLVEWFDWYTYSALALYFAPVFFPNGDTTAQLLDTAGVFAVGFLIRPVGAWLLGVYADNHGRKAALTLSILMMSVGSLMIALTPGYGRIGVLAPIMLVLARLLQGLSVGGEYGASATYIAEIAPHQWRGLAASFQAVTGILGQLLAVATLVLLQFLILTPAQLQDWGWRIPFVLGAICALTALWMRQRLHETEVFAVANRNPRGATFSLLIQHKRALAIVMGLTIGGTVAYYTYTTYAQKFLVNSAGFTKERASAINAVTLFFYMLLQPLLGMLSDRIGRRPILLAFGFLGSVFTVPLMTAISHSHDVLMAFTLIMLALVIVSGYTAINAVVKAELFPTEVRASGVALPYAVCVSLFGGTAEYIALKLKSLGHETWFYWYVSGCVLVSFLTYSLMSDTRTRDLTK